MAEPINKDSDILNQVKHIVESTLKMPSGKLDVDLGFETFGIDSIVAMEIMKNLSNEFNISLTPAQFTEVNTVRELAGTIVNSVSSTQVKAPQVTGKPNVEEVTIDSEHTNHQSISRNIPSLSKRRLQKKRLMSRTNRDDLNTNLSLLNFINKKYAIKLAPINYRSDDEIIDELLTNHFNEILSHYSLQNKSSDIGKSLSKRRVSNREVSSSIQESEADIAIVGLSCNFPDAPNAEVFWENLLSRKNSIREIPKSRWNWEEIYSESANEEQTVSKWGALIDDVSYFDSEFFGVNKEHAPLMDPQERLLLQEVYKAFQDACVDVSQLRGSNTSVFVGYEYAEYEQYLRKNSHTIENAPVFTSSSPTYYLANRISYIYDFCGPSESININCASSAMAIYRGVYSLLNNETDTAVASGVSLNLFADDYIGGTQYGMLSPDGTCGVFDDNANGFTRGEGVGTVVLKRLADAKNDNNKIYAVIKSCHQNNRGSASDISEIKHESITKVINDGYKKAAIDPNSVSYIEVDGYATKWADAFEYEGIKNALISESSVMTKSCALGSLKGNIGHLEPASGIASVIKLALSLHHKKFPASVTQTKINEFIDIESSTHPLYFADKEIAFEKIRKDKQTAIRAGVNSFADSGTNIHLLLEEYISSDESHEQSQDNVPSLFVLSAKDNSGLEQYILKYINFVSKFEPSNSIANLAYSLQTGQESMEHRVAIIATNYQELFEKLSLIKDTENVKEASLEKNGMFLSNSFEDKINPLANLITQDMSTYQIEECLATNQWQKIALMWINGVSIPWSTVWQGKKVKRISLPAYPFSKIKHWIVPDANQVANTKTKKSKLSKAKSSTKKAQGKHASKQQEGRPAGQKYVAPRNPIEDKLVNIWADVLKVKSTNIGVLDGFKDMGVDSVLATQVASKIRGQLDVNFSLKAFFEVENIADCVEVINAIKFEQGVTEDKDMNALELEEVEFEEGAL